jgi:uncharacterized membrane protein YGL010W
MPTPFRPALTLLTQYAAYHRDRRNIQTHLVGVPLTSLWYLTRGEFTLQVAVVAVMALLIGSAQVLGQSSPSWVAWGVGLFVLGWLIQFVGHYYEGRKPAFADDLVGLLVGPMFVVMELLAAAGACRALMARIEAEAGPTHLRDLTGTAA